MTEHGAQESGTEQVGTSTPDRDRGQRRPAPPLLLTPIRARGDRQWITGEVLSIFAVILALIGVSGYAIASPLGAVEDDLDSLFAEVWDADDAVTAASADAMLGMVRSAHEDQRVSGGAGASFGLPARPLTAPDSRDPSQGTSPPPTPTPGAGGASGRPAEPTAGPFVIPTSPLSSGLAAAPPTPTETARAEADGTLESGRPVGRSTPAPTPAPPATTNRPTSPTDRVPTADAAPALTERSGIGQIREPTSVAATPVPVTPALPAPLPTSGLPTPLPAEPTPLPAEPTPPPEPTSPPEPTIPPTTVPRPTMTPRPTTEPAPTLTPEPPTATPVEPTATPVPPTATPVPPTMTATPTPADPTATPTPAPTPEPDYVLIRTDAPASGLIAMSNMRPGTSVTRTVNVVNAGRLPFLTYTFSTVAAGAPTPLWTDPVNGLQLRLKRGSTVLYDGPIAVTDVDLVLALAPADTDALELTVSLPAAAGNVVQGLSQTVTVTWTATGT